jgi:cob(I)alamin adenosyltransferase
MIYTKKGDKGKTSLYGSKKLISKSSFLIEAIGSVDELNSYLGVIRSSNKDSNLNLKLEKVQDDLFTLGAILSGVKLKWNAKRVGQLENEIDKLEKILPIQKNFILPGGYFLAAQLIYARALARRVERKLVALNNKLMREKFKALVIYLNRLSDYLFILAREENYQNHTPEKVWKKF